MIEELRIQSLGVIDNAVLEFAPGLTVVTGETGAGKTMVVTGLGLLLGARADAAQVRRGAERAVVEGRVRIAPGGPVADRIASAGGTVDDDVAVVLRVVTAAGRSRAHVGGASAPIAVLSDLSVDVVAVHGQSDQQRLLHPARQKQLLDAFAGSPQTLAGYRTAYDRLRSAQTELDELTGQSRERAQEADLLRFGLGEIDGIRPESGEDADLRAEEQRLAHADELHAAAAMARAVLDDDTEQAVSARLAHARRALEGVRDHDQTLAALADRFAELGYLSTDVAADLSSYVQDIDVDPLRLAAVADRRAALAQLTRKYGATIDDVLEWAQRSSKRLAELDGTGDDLQRLTADVTKLRLSLAQAGHALSQHRTKAAIRLERSVTKELSELAMPQARLQVTVNQQDEAEGLELPDGRAVRFTADGIDEVAVLLQPHDDAPAQPLARGASGGELSRVMLALEVVLAGADSVPTFVFDEVDAGVGGKAAVEVGRRLAMLARSAQVIVVTHLPQVAAFADRHLVVAKTSDGSVTSSDVESVDDSGRARELARMLAGLEDSVLGQAHAEELLAVAAATKRTVSGS